MIGGIVLGTLLALMRLSGKPWLVTPAAPTSTPCAASRW
jgi:glutamate/aspartate transport system permease protein